MLEFPGTQAANIALLAGKNPPGRRITMHLVWTRETREGLNHTMAKEVSCINAHNKEWGIVKSNIGRML